MNSADEIEKLQTLHDQGLLTDDEFAQTKARLLARSSDESPAAGADALSAAVEHLHVWNEIIQLDLDWERERESYMVRGRYGSRNPPSEELVVIQVVFLIGFGFYIMFSASETGVTGLFLLIGLVFIIFGVGSGVFSFKKASAYKQAKQRYTERRKQLAARRSPGSREL